VSDDFEMPPELGEFVDFVDSGKVQTLRPRFDRPRLMRAPLERWKGRIWMFPFGMWPDLRHPVVVFRNGLPQLQDHEYKVAIAGDVHMTPIVISAFDHPTDVMVASYMSGEWSTKKS
jgi:hypothetical protein